VDGGDDGTRGCSFFSFYIPRKRPWLKALVAKEEYVVIINAKIR
jgi:hypothetical protein